MISSALSFEMNSAVYKEKVILSLNHNCPEIKYNIAKSVKILIENIFSVLSIR